MVHRYPFSVIHPNSHYGEQVAVYFNLHYKVFSLKEGSKNGLLLSHAGVCHLTNATFSVDPKGRQRAIRQGRKNVHAYIIGTINNLGWNLLTNVEVKSLVEQGYQQITYDLNPQHSDFYLKYAQNYTPVFTANSVILTGSTAWVLNQELKR